MSGAETTSDLGTSALADPDHLLRTRGVTSTVDAFIVGCVFSRDGSLAGFATGEGELHLAPRTTSSAADWRLVPVHDGAVLSLAADIGPQGFLTGGDDNRLCRTSGDGVVIELATGRRWVEHVASFADDKPGQAKRRGDNEAPRGLIASAVGKLVELRDGSGQLLKTLTHESTVSGIAFDAKGKRIATSHYNGASLWFAASKSDSARVLTWKGSHIGVALHPDGEALVTAMQENELHGWRLSDGHNMRMSGYPQKTQSFSFSRNGKWLATSGAEAVVLWPFFGGGPMGKPPTELAGVPDSVCTRVVFHPQHEIVAAGFADGTVLMSDVGSRRVLPVCGAGHGSVSALSFSSDGSALAFGTTTGRMAVVDIAARS
ncbi:WD40 repeat domain-containing protein [Lichenicola sp.]|uniref:WD40 repeat domain-containing protein n=1 Tax=Lichenicola sp. TaxID=2804529 RepID=UPI003B002A50